MKRNVRKCTIFILVLAMLLTQVFVFVPGASAAVNMAQGKPITASSYTQTYVATNANDGNTSTYWEAAPNSYPNVLTVDLQATQTVNQVVVKLNPATAWATRTQTFSVLTSTDNSTYTTKVASATYTFNPSTNANTATINFANTSARYVRLNFTANSGASGAQVAEFQVFGVDPTGQCDLVVTDITWSPASPATGNEVRFSAVIRNQGTAASPAGVIHGVSFSVNGTQVNWSDTYTSSIAAGASVTVTASGGPSSKNTWTAGANGNYTVTAWVDDVNRITNESNESNNQFSKTLTVGGGVPTPTPTTTPNGQPDLVVTNITWSPANPAAGNEVTFSAVIKNQGTGSKAAGTINGVLFQINGTSVNWSDTNTSAINPGASITVTANGGPSSKASWTAGANGNYTVLAWVDDVNRIAESNESNNQYTKTLTVGGGTVTPTPTPSTPPVSPSPIPSPVPGSRGATVPYTRYESENGTRGGAAVLRSATTFDYSQTASEASNQQYVALPSNGSYVEWTIGNGGAGVNMRFTMPDSSNGMGNNGSLDCYVNGTKVATISLTSYYSWQYFQGDQPGDAPNGGQAAFRFDETHWKLATALKSGDKLRIQKNNGDGFEYGVDFVEVEPVPGAIAQPANSVSVTSYGATPDDSSDDLAAFNSAVSAAVSQGKTLYIPAGKFNLGNMWVIGSTSSPISRLTVTGAGMWHTNLQFTNANSASGGISLRMTQTGTLDFSNVYINSNLRSRYGQNAIYKCFMDNFGTNSRIHDFWEEHFECGFWVGDYAHTPAWPADGLQIYNGRIRNNLADGVNFCQGTKNSTVQNCSVRNNGDDGLAVWPDSTMGAPMGVNNTFNYNTIENNWRAAAIAIFGGSGHKAQYNYIKDCFMGSGIRLNTVFPGYHFENNTGILFSDTTIINSGTSKDCYSGERGAIDLEASNTSIRNVTFQKIDIINAQRDGIQIGYGGGFSGISFIDVNINGTGKDNITTSRFTQSHLGEAIMVYTTNGTATFTRLVTSNIEAPEKYLIPSGFNAIFN